MENLLTDSFDKRFDPERVLAKARNALAKDPTDVEAMWAIARSPLAGDSEKADILEAFSINIPEIIEKRELAKYDGTFSRDHERTSTNLLFEQCSLELEKQGAYKDALKVYKAAEAMLGFDTRFSFDSFMKQLHMRACIRMDSLEDAKAVCDGHGEDPAFPLCVSSLYFHKGDMENARAYLDMFIERSMFAEEFIEAMTDEGIVRIFKDGNIPISCYPEKLGPLAEWFTEDIFPFDQKGFFLWANEEIERETQERTNSGQYRENFFDYEEDFLSSSDITAYFNYKSPVGLLRKEGRLYRLGFDGKLHLAEDTEDKDIVFPYIEGIPEKTYIAWCSRRPGQRVGYALVCYKGQWRIARRTGAMPDVDDHMRPCTYREECMKLHLKKVSRKKKFSDYIFLFSGTDKKQKWQPQKIQIWALLPESLYDRDDLFIGNMRLDCYLLSCWCIKEPDGNVLANWDAGRAISAKDEPRVPSRKCRYKKMLSDLDKGT